MIISIDGIDGAGKNTQAQRIKEQLLNKNFPVRVVSFPKYESFFGNMVSEYLNGTYGSLYSINPKLASLIYAQDRHLFFQNNVISDNEILIFDRYVYSNIAHHASKVVINDRQIFIDWIFELEYSVNKIPKPDISFILDLEIENSMKNVSIRGKEKNTDSTNDMHESNYDYLEETRNVFLSLKEYANTFLITCDNHGTLRTQDDITNDIMLLITRKFNEENEDLQ